MDYNHKNILISCCHGIGDVITLTASLRKLKELYTTCRITLMSHPYYAVLFEGLPYIDQFIGFTRHGFGSRLKYLPLIAKQNAVIFFDYQPHLLLMSYLFHSSARCGIVTSGGGHRIKQLYTHVLPGFKGWTEVSAGENWAKQIGSGLSIDLQGDMTTYDVVKPNLKAYEETENLLNKEQLTLNQKYILFSPFGQNPTRCLSKEFIKEFVSKAQKAFRLPIILTGAPSQTEMAAGCAEHNLVGKTTLIQSVVLIERAYLVVTVDSGPLHIADSFRKKTVAIFSASSIKRWAPKYNCEIVHVNMPCSPCNKSFEEVSCNGECIKAITVEMVLDACKKML